eukprot:TRINITY_DN49654_c0_g1_i1.p1 TRINITY_DN49654_c0_g1~~TRINITY_DN49654_c0_g1_i1.p1  ORF type:complete len:638 (+),score=97.96 TRINITY_DN49654_c0_g1_i1:298-2211(+)
MGGRHVALDRAWVPAAVCESPLLKRALGAFTLRPIRSRAPSAQRSARLKNLIQVPVDVNSLGSLWDADDCAHVAEAKVRTAELRRRTLELLTKAEAYERLYEEERNAIARQTLPSAISPEDTTAENGAARDEGVVAPAATAVQSSPRMEMPASGEVASLCSQSSACSDDCESERLATTTSSVSRNKEEGVVASERGGLILEEGTSSPPAVPTHPQSQTPHSVRRHLPVLAASRLSPSATPAALGISGTGQTASVGVDLETHACGVVTKKKANGPATRVALLKPSLRVPAPAGKPTSVPTKTRQSSNRSGRYGVKGKKPGPGTKSQPQEETEPPVKVCPVPSRSLHDEGFRTIRDEEKDPTIYDVTREIEYEDSPFTAKISILKATTAGSISIHVTPVEGPPCVERPAVERDLDSQTQDDLLQWGALTRALPSDYGTRAKLILACPWICSLVHVKVHRTVTRVKCSVGLKGYDIACSQSAEAGFASKLAAVTGPLKRLLQAHQVGNKLEEDYKNFFEPEVHSPSMAKRLRDVKYIMKKFDINECTAEALTDFYLQLDTSGDSSVDKDEFLEFIAKAGVLFGAEVDSLRAQRMWLHASGHSEISGMTLERFVNFVLEQFPVIQRMTNWEIRQLVAKYFS